jgi:ADP-ribose pyrophosphatase YjhB (NUDIX family)
MTPEAIAVRNSAKAVVIHENRVLLIRANLDGEDCYLLPGGGQEPGETLSEAVVREVLEETGLAVRVERLLWINEFIGRNHFPGDPRFEADHRVEITFQCSLTGDPLLLGGQLPDAVQTGLEWIPLVDVPTANLIVKALPGRIAALAHDPNPAVAYLGDVL